MSHLADEEHANMAMDNVMKYLYTDKGLITHYPASEGFDRGKKYNITVKKDASVETGLYVNGTHAEGNIVPWNTDGETVEVVLVLR